MKHGIGFTDVIATLYHQLICITQPYYDVRVVNQTDRNIHHTYTFPMP